MAGYVNDSITCRHGRCSVLFAKGRVWSTDYPFRPSQNSREEQVSAGLGADGLRPSHPAALVDGGQGDRIGDGLQAQLGFADQVLDDPAAAVAAPVADAPLLA